MPLNASILNRLAAIKLPARAYPQVLSLIAEICIQVDEAEQRAKERRERNADRMRSVRAQSSHSARTDGAQETHGATHCAEVVSPKPPSLLTSTFLSEGNTEVQQGKSGVCGTSDWPRDFREQFWAIYPNKVGKKAAISKLERVQRSGEIAWDPLISAVQNIKTDDPKFIPHPLTWLNQGRYLDAESSEKSAPIPEWIREGLARQEAWRKSQNGQATDHQELPREGSGHDCNEQGNAQKDQYTLTDL